MSAGAVDVLAVLRHNAHEATKKYGPDNQDVAVLTAVCSLMELADWAHSHVLGVEMGQQNYAHFDGMRRLLATPEIRAVLARSEARRHG